MLLLFPQKTLDALPENAIQVAADREIDLAQTQQEMREIQNGSEYEGEVSQIIHRAERGLALLNALEGYSI